MDLDPFRKFAQLHAAYKAADAEKKRLKSELDAMQEALVSTMALEGVPRVSIDVEGVGSLTLFPRTTRYARPLDGDAERMHEALREAGMGDIVKETVNTNTLSAIVRESLDPENDSLPEELMATIDVSEKHEMALRKST